MAISETQIDTILKNIPKYFKLKNIVNGKPVLNKRGNPYCAPGGLCRVYKYEMEDGSIKALRIWSTLINEAKERSEAIAKFIVNHPCEYLVNFEFIENAFSIDGRVFPVVLMDWCEGENMKEYIDNNIHNSVKIKELANSFKEMVQNLHHLGISHGDLHHENIMIDQNGKIKLIDYDSMYVPELENYKDECRGYDGYQHPTARAKNIYLSPKLDYYSELIIYLSLCLLTDHPELWTAQVKEYDKELLLRVNDLHKIDLHKDHSIPGIHGMIEQLKMFLSYDSISQLKPLEKVLEIVFPISKTNIPISSADISSIKNKFNS